MENNAPMPLASRRKNGLFVTIAFVILALGSAATGYYFFFYQRELPVTDDTAKKPALSAEISNPVEYFFKHFSVKDYQVAIDQGGKGNSTFTFYYQKGVLIRVDTHNTYGDTSAIIKDGKLYSLNNKDKTFAELEMSAPQAQHLLAIYKVGSMIDPILQGETPIAPPWILIPESTGNGRQTIGYRTSGRKLLSYAYVPDNVTVDIEVYIDPTTGLFSSIVMNTPGKQDKAVAELHYTEIGDIESLKRFPMNYKKVDPI
ncbi:MAG: hypothetical protein WBO92_00510 [Candidatus Moraniibacteriota bacterium]